MDFSKSQFFICTTCLKNLLNIFNAMCITFCTRNVQNVSKKNRGKNLFSKSLPRVSLVFSILSNYSSTAACAAARRAIGTRNGEQEA